MKKYQVWASVFIANPGIYAVQPIKTFNTEKEAIDAASVAPEIHPLEFGWAKYTWGGLEIESPDLMIIESEVFNHPKRERE